MIPSIIIFAVSILAINAEDNTHGSDNSFECLRKDDLQCTLFDHDGSWIQWKITEDTCIKKDYLAFEVPKKNILIPLFAGDWNTSVIEIDEKKKTLQIDLNMELVWEDVRIKAYFTNNKVPRRLPLIRKNIQPYLWTPYIWPLYVKDVKYIFDPIIYDYVALLSNVEFNRTAYHLNATLVQVYLYWHVTIPCNFDFSSFPFDDQSCVAELGAYDVNVTQFDATKKSHGTFEVMVKQGFVITREFHSDMEEDDKRFSKFGYKFHIKRLIKPYVFQYFIPSLAIVVISSLSFVIPISATPARVGLGVTQFLTLTNLFIHQRAESPSGSNLSALDYYMLVCLFFVFATMIEFALNLLVSRNYDDPNTESKCTSCRPKNEMNDREGSNKSMQINEKCRSRCEMTSFTILQRSTNGPKEDTETSLDDSNCKKLRMTSKIDITAFIGFTFGFFVFNLCYCAIYFKFN